MTHSAFLLLFFPFFLALKSHQGFKQEDTQNLLVLKGNAVHLWRMNVILDFLLVKDKRKMHDRHSRVMCHTFQIIKLDFETDGATAS